MLVADIELRAPDRIVGRVDEMQRLQAAVDRARAGEKLGIVITGESGIGKTTLLRWAMDQADAGGILTGYVRAPASAGLPPRFPMGELFAGISDACDRHHVEPPPELRRVLDTLRGRTSAAEYPAELPHIINALAETAARAPIALFIDDFQWVPQESMDLILATMRLLESSALLIMSGRTESGPVLQQSGDFWLDVIELESLTDTETARLVDCCTSRSPVPSLLASLMQVSRGNPLLALEALRHWRDGRLLSQLGRHLAMAAPVESVSLPSAKLLFHARIKSLPSDALGLLGLISLLGRDAHLDELESAYDGERPFPEALAALERTDLVRVEVVGHFHYRLAHPLIDRVVDELTPSSRQVELHRHILHALSILAASGVKVSEAELAHHSQLGAIDHETLRDRFRAAAEDAATRGSLSDAAVWFGKLAHIERQPERRHAALLAQADALQTSQPQAAIAIYDHLQSDLSTKADRLQVTIGRAQARRVLGDFVEAHVDLEHAATLDPDNFSVNLGLAALAGIQNRPSEARTRLLALKSKLPPGPGDELSNVLARLALVHLAEGAVVAARAELEDALECAITPQQLAYVESNLCWLLILEGQWDRAATALARRISEAEVSGNYWDLSLCLTNAARLHAWRGNHAIAIDYAFRARRVAATLASPSCRADAEMAIASAHYEAGHLDLAFKAATLGTSLLDAGTEPMEQSGHYLLAAEIGLQLGNLKSALAWAEAASRHIDNTQYLSASVLRIQGLVENHLGRTQVFHTLMMDAVAAQSPVPHVRASIFESAAESCWQVGARRDGIALAEEAKGIYESLNAHARVRVHDWLVGRTESKKRQPHELTDRERDVVKLVVSGLTNREIAEHLVLSPATIKRHMERIFRKTGARKRSDLVRMFSGSA